MLVSSQSIFLRFADGLIFYLLVLALDMDVGYLEIVFVTVLLALASMIPAAPGFIGTFEVSILLGLSLYGFDKQSALTFALLAHSWMFIVWLGVSGSAILTLPRGVIWFKKNV